MAAPEWVTYLFGAFGATSFLIVILQLVFPLEYMRSSVRGLLHMKEDPIAALKARNVDLEQQVRDRDNEKAELQRQLGEAQQQRDAAVTKGNEQQKALEEAAKREEQHKKQLKDAAKGEGDLWKSLREAKEKAEKQDEKLEDAAKREDDLREALREAKEIAEKQGEDNEKRKEMVIGLRITIARLGGQLDTARERWLGAAAGRLPGRREGVPGFCGP